MAIISKTEMAVHIAKLEQNYQELRQLLNGEELNPNIWNLYSFNPDDYKRDFAEINLTKLGYAIDACRSSLTKLAGLKTKAAKPLKQDK